MHLEGLFSEKWARSRSAGLGLNTVICRREENLFMFNVEHQQMMSTFPEQHKAVWSGGQVYKKEPRGKQVKKVIFVNVLLVKRGLSTGWWWFIDGWKKVMAQPTAGASPHGIPPCLPAHPPPGGRRGELGGKDRAQLAGNPSPNKVRLEERSPETPLREQKG